MTDSKPKGNQADVFLWCALGIALAAFGLRLSLINFSSHSHPDEPIVAALMERSVNQGILTANWAGFEPVLEPANLSIFAIYFGPIRDCQAGPLAHQPAIQS